MISNEQIEEIIDKTDIVDLVSQYVSLEKAGAGFKGLCPFHNEKTPSFMVSPSKKIAKCMGCGGGGNPISFLMQIKNISYPEALNELAQRAGIKLEGIKTNKKKEEFTNYYKMMETSKKFFQYILFNSKSGLEALDYLHKRGIDDETIKRFEIGLAPNSSNALYTVLQKENYPDLDMVLLGLVKSGNTGFYDLFQNRIMFPITDEEGHTIAFSGRIFNNDDPNQAKYVNSPESPIFKKSNTLFHLSDAISEIRKSHRIVLHEGQMDVIASVKSGIPEAICSMGTALTREQVKIMKKYASEIIVCYDGDKAGINAMLKAYNLLSNESINFKMVMLPDKEDPDSFVKTHGADNFIKYFNDNQLEPLDFILAYATKDKDFNNIGDVESAKSVLFNALSHIDSQVSVDRYIDKLSQVMNVSKSSLLVDFNKYINIPTGSNYVEFEYDYQNNFISETKVNYLANYAKAELRLINYAKLGRNKANEIESGFSVSEPFVSYLEPIHQDLWFKLIDEYYILNEDFNEGLFLRLLDKRLYNCYVNDLESLRNTLDEYIPYNENDMAECIKVIIDSKPRREIDKIDKKFSELTEDQKKIELLQKIENAKKINNSKNKRK